MESIDFYEFLENINKKSLKKTSSFFDNFYLNSYYRLALGVLTVNRFLPFALLFANTLLPFAVAILSRKPCLFLRFLSEG